MIGVERVAEFLLDLPCEADQGEIAIHLSQCDTCRGRFDDLAAAVCGIALSYGEPGDEVDPPAGFVDAVIAQIHNKHRLRTRRCRRRCGP